MNEVMSELVKIQIVNVLKKVSRRRVRYATLKRKLPINTPKQKRLFKDAFKALVKEGVIKVERHRKHKLVMLVKEV